jgi:cell wall-associated NlpC family hydrolase
VLPVPAPAPAATPAQIATLPVPSAAFTVSAAGTTGGLAARAVSAAVGQVGTPYVYGGAAPGGFDCSGLIQWAFKRAGINLPRTASAQSTVGRSVSVNQLQPGDLLFFYSPVEHVAVYVGAGKIAEASTKGVPVHVRPMYLTGFVGARRVV